MNSARAIETLLNAREAAQLLSIHPVTLLRFAREGRVPRIRLGRLVRFRASDLMELEDSAYTDSAVRAAQLKGEGA